LAGAESLDDLSPEWAWGGATGEGVRVAVIDSGIEADHPALEGCVDADAGVAISLDSEGNVVETIGPHGDDFGHGTACAGIIHSLAPQARITSVKVLGAGLTGKAAAFLRGLGWAVEHDFDVINLSLGTSRRDWALAFYEVCDQAYFRGSLVVTAANNVTRPSFPSLYASVVSVACNLTTDPFRFHFNPEPPTEFLARGIDVDVAWREGGRMRSTGNSYAAPHLSGIAALVRSKHPDLRPFQVKAVLWATAANVQEAPQAAGRLTNRVRAGTTSLRATSALRAVQH
jgi:subtilisin family serine protease